MKTIYMLGECMVELKAIEDGVMHQAFAGDIYNSAVYLKRSFPEISTSMITVVGNDKLSDRMLAGFENEKIDTQFAFRHLSKSPGLYMIETDENGERSFIYWRSDSAARKVMSFIDNEVIEQLTSGDMFFYSGISLAVIEESSRNDFWQKLKQLKSAGVKVVFDPNYRARLWQSEEDARQQFNIAFELADVALPGVEDLSSLYGGSSAQGVVDFCQRYKVDEIVVKNGPESVITWVDGELLTHTITPVSNVVDTTSAGDAFNGVYLGSRLSGRTVSDAVRLAASAASIVIQYPGAIAPQAAFNQAMSNAGI